MNKFSLLLIGLSCYCLTAYSQIEKEYLVQYSAGFIWDNVVDVDTQRLGASLLLTINARLRVDKVIKGDSSMLGEWLSMQHMIKVSPTGYRKILGFRLYLLGGRGDLFYFENKYPNRIEYSTLPNGNPFAYAINASTGETMGMRVIKDYQIDVYRPESFTKSMYGGQVIVRFKYDPD